MTPTVAQDPNREKVISAIQRMGEDDFEEGNDPYGEHDFGAVEVEGETYYFKIDYYNETLDAHGYDTFVMLIMHASDY